LNYKNFFPVGYKYNGSIFKFLIKQNKNVKTLTYNRFYKSIKQIKTKAYDFQVEIISSSRFERSIGA
jgi:hypothetical protein